MRENEKKKQFPTINGNLWLLIMNESSLKHALIAGILATGIQIGQIRTTFERALRARKIHIFETFFGFFR
uniref:Uncharacterized protein n=1 Tax=Romanomermis culicivorax TaxID=13658 RepID=A0A915J8Q5_ROMCU